MKTIRTYAYFLTVLACMGITCRAEDSSACAEARSQRRRFTDEFMEVILADPKPPAAAAKADPQAPVYAMAALYTEKDIPGGNQRMRDAWDRLAGPDKEMTPEEAAEAKWHMRGMLRVYYLFYDKSDVFPGRLEPDVQAKLEELFFKYGSYKSTVKRADLANVWHIQGSENHDMMDLSNAYLSLQAIQNIDAYKDKKLPDGHTPADHVAAWEKYYARYCLERAKNGLFVEISPTYGKWFMGEIVNMYEFARNPVVKKRMEMLLHLTWADWAVDQLNGVRGGGKTRCYQGGYSQRGGGDSWDRMGRVLFGMEPWHWNSYGGLSTLALLTSRYELPDVVMDIAFNKGDFEPFVYQSIRTAKVLKSPRERYVMDPKGGGILRYSYCAPESIMGSWMVDTRSNYAAINTQNRWQGVIFATGPDARVFPQSVGLGNRKTYEQHAAVQHRNVMVVKNHPNARQTGRMRVYFPGEFRDKLIEKDGWVIVREGEAWLGVRVLDGKADSIEKNYEFRGPDKSKEQMKEASRHDSDCLWLWAKAGNPPVAFVTSRVGIHATLDDFLAYLKSHEYGITEGQAFYSFVDDLGSETRLEVGGKLPVPTINGKPVNLYPRKAFGSPYLSADHGSGIVTIQKGKRKLTLDFNK
ncbi:MAG: hypothetical protein RRC34_11015 [Lentisphaeria bacterium]|nr:hypothetical protein [Lentisphaeria bacterium]